MYLSKIEVEIIRFLNEFGCCEINEVMNRFEIRKTCAYEYIDRLYRHELISKVRVMKYHPAIYRLTKKAIDLFRFDLPELKRLPLNVYDHHITVVKLYIKLMKTHPDCSWISERHLLRDKPRMGFGDNFHLPDGSLVDRDGKQYAIEVERSQKSTQRLEDIILGYGLQTIYHEVWYFCLKEALSAVSRVASQVSYVKVYSLSDYV